MPVVSPISRSSAMQFLLPHTLLDGGSRSLALGKGRRNEGMRIVDKRSPVCQESIKIWAHQRKSVDKNGFQVTYRCDVLERVAACQEQVSSFSYGYRSTQGCFLNKPRGFTCPTAQSLIGTQASSDKIAQFIVNGKTLVDIGIRRICSQEQRCPFLMENANHLSQEVVAFPC